MFRKCSGYGITWKVILTFLFPVLLLPLPILWPGSVSRCLYVLSLMGSYWSVSSHLLPSLSHLNSGVRLLELLPISATSLIPVVLFPLLGIMTTAQVSEIIQVVTHGHVHHLGECLLPQVLLHVIHGRAHGGHRYRTLKPPQVSHGQSSVSVTRFFNPRRVGLRVLLMVGSSPRRVLLGFMLPTAVLSMWISNTATTAMMIPILEAVLVELGSQHR